MFLAGTMIFDDAKWNDFIANPDANKLQQDPAYAHASTFVKIQANIFLFISSSLQKIMSWVDYISKASCKWIQ